MEKKESASQNSIVSFFDYLPGPDVVTVSQNRLQDPLDLGIKVLIDIGISSGLNIIETYP